MIAFVSEVWWLCSSQIYVKFMSILFKPNLCQFMSVFLSLSLPPPPPVFIPLPRFLSLSHSLSHSLSPSPSPSPSPSNCVCSFTDSVPSLAAVLSSVHQVTSFSLTCSRSMTRWESTFGVNLWTWHVVFENGLKFLWVSFECRMETKLSHLKNRRLVDWCYLKESERRTHLSIWAQVACIQFCCLRDGLIQWWMGRGF